MSAHREIPFENSWQPLDVQSSVASEGRPQTDEFERTSLVSLMWTKAHHIFFGVDDVLEARLPRLLLCDFFDDGYALFLLALFHIELQHLPGLCYDRGLLSSLPRCCSATLAR